MEDIEEFWVGERRRLGWGGGGTVERRRSYNVLVLSVSAFFLLFLSFL